MHVFKPVDDVCELGEVTQPAATRFDPESAMTANKI